MVLLSSVDAVGEAVKDAVSTVVSSCGFEPEGTVAAPVNSFLTSEDGFLSLPSGIETPPEAAVEVFRRLFAESLIEPHREGRLFFTGEGLLLLF